jgi:hypothetical protein
MFPAEERGKELEVGMTRLGGVEAPIPRPKPIIMLVVVGREAERAGGGKMGRIWICIGMWVWDDWIPTPGRFGERIPGFGGVGVRMAVFVGESIPPPIPIPAFGDMAGPGLPTSVFLRDGGRTGGRSKPLSFMFTNLQATLNSLMSSFPSQVTSARLLQA